MKLISFPTRAEAEKRSREEWEKHIGRPKRAEDVTEFFWAVNETTTGAAALSVPLSDEALLTVKEKASLDTASLRIADLDGADFHAVGVFDDVVAGEKGVADGTVAGGDLVRSDDG